MTEAPFFSIVLSTYGRGRHIAPTIVSLLRQSYADFELIVVGDGCDDETEATVRSFPQERIVWRNLPHNTGSQSFPNNDGIRAARGSWIAYLGHDDVWAPDHLEALAARIANDPALDFVTSGCVYHGPPGSEMYWVTGLFDDSSAASEQFFPPSALAHRRDVTTRIGEWRDPRIIRPPVDAEFVLRAVHAGLRFGSTSRITAHKFAAGHRYLSYLRARSDEQEEMLRRLQTGLDSEALVETARRIGLCMPIQHPDYSAYPAGYLFERNRQNKGLSRSALQPLRDRVVMEQTDEYRALDWYAVEHSEKKFRWSGPSPRPRILIPYTGESARLAIDVFAKPPGADLAEIAVTVEGQSVQCRVERAADGPERLAVEIPLAAADYTIVTLLTPMFRPSDAGLGADSRKLGIAVTDIVLEPG
jgi:glycosyltransferase involved in cell wall biosynthesis